MNILSALKCLLCLIKCSKYLYYIKKVICFAFLAVAVVAGLSLLSGESNAVKKIKEMI